jgi:hypothetical protein
MKEEAFGSVIDLKNYDLPCKLSHIPFSYKSPEVPALEEASHLLHFGDHIGNVIAVSETKALSALHGLAKLGDEVTLTDGNGVTRKGSVVFIKFESCKVDIALIELNVGQSFPFFVTPCHRPLKLQDRIFVIGVTSSVTGSGDTVIYLNEAKVTGIEKGTDNTLCWADYAAKDGLSGAGIVIALEEGQYRTAGVHIGTHDDTEAPPPIKRMKGGGTDADSVSESIDSLARSIHGHTAVCLICDVVRVEGLKDIISA